MILPLAHAGHWLPDLLIYGSPIVLGIAAIKWVDWHERRKEAQQLNSSTAQENDL
jgi:hypothetical protein